MHIAGPRPPIRSQERSTAMKSMLASMAVVLTFCASPAAAAEFPKTGSAEYDTYYVDNPVAKIDSGVGTGTIVDETGITRNVKGEGPFNDMSVRCLYHWSSVGETFHLKKVVNTLSPSLSVSTQLPWNRSLHGEGHLGDQITEAAAEL